MSIHIASTSHRRRLSRHLALAVCTLLASPVFAEEASKKPAPIPGAFTIETFRLESGVVLPRAVVIYGTYGTLNAAKDNAVLLPSHYMAQSDGYDWLVGEGRALDPRKHFLIMTELFGNGRSSSPSNTPEPFHGPRFPVTTIRDNVEAVRRLLEDGLGIHHLKAVVGFSMGAEQAFQWAVSHPRFADRIVVTSGTARCWPHGIVRLEGQIRAITADPAFKGGDYTDEPVQGIETTGAVWLAWLYSQAWWKRELWKTTDAKAAGMTLAQFTEAQTKELFAGADANNLILQMRTGSSTTWEGRPASTGAPKRRFGRSSLRYCICRRRRTSTSRSATRGRRRIGSARSRSRPSRRSGAIRPARGRAPRTWPSSRGSCGPSSHRAERGRSSVRRARRLASPAMFRPFARRIGASCCERFGASPLRH
jgi:homoserine O-acetyltransferase/O-succinyltransferase